MGGAGEYILHVFTWGIRRCQFPPQTQAATFSSLGTSGDSRLLLSPQGCLRQRRRWDRTEKGLDLRAQPSPCTPQPLLLPAPGEGSLGQRLCFPYSSYVCGSAARAGRRGSRLQSPQRRIKMTAETEAEGRGAGRARRASRAGSPDTHTCPPREPRLQGPLPPTAGVRAGGGSPPSGPAPAGKAWVGLPGRPHRAPPPRAPGPDSPAAGGAGAQLRGARGAISPGRGAAARGAGAAAVGAARTISGGSLAPQGLRRVGRGRRMRADWGDPQRRAQRTRRSDLFPSFSTAGCLRRWLPAGPVSGLSAEDPPPGAALRLLRRRRMRRRPLLPASRPPRRPRGTPGTSPAGEARRGGEADGGSVPAPQPTPPHPDSLPRLVMQAWLPGKGAGRRWRPAWESSSSVFIERLLSASTVLTLLRSYLRASGPDLGRLSSVDQGERKGAGDWRQTLGVSGHAREGYTGAKSAFQIAKVLEYLARC